jgi:pyruvate, water dikinase
VSAVATDTHTRRLADLRSADEGAFGGKSASLGELIAAEIPVPPGFAVATSAFHAFLGETGLRARVDEALAGLDVSDVDALQAASRAVASAMASVAVPGAVRDEVAAQYAALAAAAGEAEPAVAVRSSAVGEDSADATFAGQQETYLWVRGADAVCAAIRDCWASLYSAPALAYRAKMADAALVPAMGVTVQLMVDAEVSGVMFTCSPLTGDPSIVAVNASWGLGLGVVGGEVTPDEYHVSKVTREVVRRTVNAKHVEYRPDASDRGTVCVAVEAARQEQACLGDEELRALAEVGRRVERYFGGHQDIEWAIARTGAVPESLFVVQSRPVTATGGAAREEQKPAPAPSSALSMVMSTFGVTGAGQTTKQD